jgi:hypothetical protein
MKKHIAFYPKFYEAMQPFHGGDVYVNYFGADRIYDWYGAPHVRQADSSQAALRSHQHVSKNQNIPPSVNNPADADLLE